MPRRPSPHTSQAQANAHAERHSLHPRPLPPQPDWSAALCTHHPEPDLWSSTAATTQAYAIAICQRCPVIAPCAAYALSLSGNADRSGTWGGTTATQREAIRRQRRAAIAAAVAA
jgi:hypothetical protein